jgi:hypothetical protein
MFTVTFIENVEPRGRRNEGFTLVQKDTRLLQQALC